MAGGERLRLLEQEPSATQGCPPLPAREREQESVRAAVASVRPRSMLGQLQWSCSLDQLPVAGPSDVSASPGPFSLTRES